MIVLCQPEISATLFDLILSILSCLFIFGEHLKLRMSIFRRKSIERITQDAANDQGHSVGLNKVLGKWDLTFMGIAAIIGAGSFSSMGTACASGGPGVVILFIICGIACGFTALCYSEFASRIPVSGSAYTYAYASFGEMIAWVIGWALLLEYSIGNIYVAFSWSDYFTNLLESFHLHMPDWMTISYSEAKKTLADSAEAKAAWKDAPMLGSLRIIFDFPALLINFLITWLVYVGVKESRNISNLMVFIKLAVVLMVILVGAFYIDPANWFPKSEISEGHSFMPNGFSGVMMGVASVFFAYIGFDAVSTMAEESKDPQRDLPKGMIYSLVICTVIYILLSLVLTGMVNYKALNVGDPLAEVFSLRHIGWMGFFISICAVAAMTSVILVFQLGQPRIWMTMSRDGLLPKKFQTIHPKHKTPSFATIITGLVVGVPILFTERNFVLDFTSIGTLFAFVLVCGGVLLLPRKEKIAGKFHLTHIDSHIIFPAIVLSAFAVAYFLFPGYFSDLVDFNKKDANLTFQISSIIFWLILPILSVFAILRKWSLIPLLGLSTCLYLLTGMSAPNWFWFAVWFSVGLVIYFLYGYKRSRLALEEKSLDRMK